ncbi:MAG TPA: hypothetical protein VM840_11430 [Actinomycetota bacterium]|nr:hypothetical protein [Actinomycetota bacterium]
MSWQAGVLANGIVAVAYLAASVVILFPVIRSKQVRTNPLALATAALLVTCAVHHGQHAVQMLLAVGPQMEAGLAPGSAWRWDMAVWDVVTAAVGACYWAQRRSDRSAVRDAQLFEDMKQRQRQALEINDNIVQGLTVAQISLDLAMTDRSEEAIHRTLASARAIITELIGEASEVGLGPGDLRRTKPAEVG